MRTSMVKHTLNQEIGFELSIPNEFIKISDIDRDYSMCRFFDIRDNQYYTCFLTKNGKLKKNSCRIESTDN